MANTIIQIKSSGVTGNVPSSLQPGELAINYFDGQLFYGNTLSQAVPYATVTEPSGLDGELQFNDSGSFGSDAGLKYNNTTKTLNVTNLVVGTTNVKTTLEAAYVHANSAYDYANALSGGTATDGVARTLANSAQLHANSAYIHANAAYTAANNATDTWVRNAANSASSYANSAYTKANNALANTTGTFAGSLTLTGNLTATSITTTGSSGDISGANVVYANTFTANTRITTPSLQVTGDTTITGNLTVTGVTTYANTTTVNLGDNIITLNADIPQASAPSENAGIEVDRGSSANVGVIWNESTDKWTFTNDGTNYSDIGSSAAESYANSAYAQANTGTTLAQAAFDTANTLTGGTATDGWAREQANTANSTAQAAFDKANTSSGAVLVTSNVTSVSSGATIAVAIDMANVAYPGGIFTIYQQDAYVLTVTDTWYTGSTNKNAYSNLAAGIVNTQNVNVSITLTNATFNVQTGDTITIGSSVVTGANLISLGISGTGGNYVIPSSYLLSNVQTNSSSAVSASLTTSRGVATDAATTLTNTQATPFNVSSISASFPSSTVPYFNKNQTFSWSASVTGTVVSGNVTYSGASSGTLTSSGATSGTSGSLDSTLSYTVSSSDYRGTGLNGAGTKTIDSTVSRNITAATSYTPLFYKTTSSSSNPNFTTSDTYITMAYAVGQGANTTSTESNYLWIAIPGTDSHEFAFTFLNTPVVVEPTTSYTGQTISGQSYNVYGFTNFSEVTNIYTTS
jgi:hypothetical protein